jgi:hypothetical protein
MLSQARLDDREIDNGCGTIMVSATEQRHKRCVVRELVLGDPAPHRGAVAIDPKISVVRGLH